MNNIGKNIIEIFNGQIVMESNAIIQEIPIIKQADETDINDNWVNSILFTEKYLSKYKNDYNLLKNCKINVLNKESEPFLQERNFNDLLNTCPFLAFLCLSIRQGSYISHNLFNIQQKKLETTIDMIIKGYKLNKIIDYLGFDRKIKKLSLDDSYLVIKSLFNVDTEIINIIIQAVIDNSINISSSIDLIAHVVGFYDNKIWKPEYLYWIIKNISNIADIDQDIFDQYYQIYSFCRHFNDYLKDDNKKFEKIFSMNLSFAKVGKIITEHMNDTDISNFVKNIKFCIYGDPWIPEMIFDGGLKIEPVMNSDDLIAESIELKHCAVYSHDNIKTGKCFFYSIKKSGKRKATIKLVRTGGMIRIGEVKGYRNSNVGEEYMKMIKCWINCQTFNSGGI